MGGSERRTEIGWRDLARTGEEEKRSDDKRRRDTREFRGRSVAMNILIVIENERRNRTRRLETRELNHFAVIFYGALV